MVSDRGVCSGQPSHSFWHCTATFSSATLVHDTFETVHALFANNRAISDCSLLCPCSTASSELLVWLPNLGKWRLFFSCMHPASLHS